MPAATLAARDAATERERYLLRCLLDDAAHVIILRHDFTPLLPARCAMRRHARARARCALSVTDATPAQRYTPEAMTAHDARSRVRRYLRYV